MNTASQTPTLHIDPVLPPPLLILLAALLFTFTVVVYLRDLPKVGTLRCISFLCFRLLGLGGLFLILLNPQRERHEVPKQVSKKVIIALDHSQSMAHTDFDTNTRIDETKRIIDQSNLIENGHPIFPGLHFYRFSESANRMPPEELAGLQALGTDTRFHRSLRSMLQNADSGEALAGILILSDGHDLELVNPARTAIEANMRGIPIFTLPIGSAQPVRDASLRIASYQPYVFSGQHARIDVAIRLIGCEYEDFTLTLFREGERVQERRVAVGDELQRLESFEVLEKTPGQYAYEVRLSTVQNEVNTDNNRATTFLNVSDKKINLLLLEGSPYWDTNFTQRSLWANDKFNIDIAVSIAPGKIRLLRKDGTLGELTIPKTDLDFDAYDCVLLGQRTERLIDTNGQEALAKYVRDLGGNLIFLRAQPTEGASPLDRISPVQWGDTLTGFSEIEVAQAGRSAAPFNLLSMHSGQKTLRPLLSVQKGKGRELSTVLASTRMPGHSEPMPVMVHRRAGSGQVLSIASGGFWRNGFHADLFEATSLFDSFWDNLILWMIAGRNVQSGGDYSVLLSTANLALGQAIHLRLTAREANKLPVGIPIEFYRDGESAAVERTTLSAHKSENQLTASFTPAGPGIYRVAVPLPDGESKALRFAVYDDNRERTEVSVDRPYLKQLATKSGGRMIEGGEVRPLVQELLHQSETEPLVHREPAWPIPLLAWLIGGCFSLDWLLRRRSGLC